MRAALAAPDRVRALILLDTQAGPEAPEAIEAYGSMADTWLEVGPVDDLVNIIAGIIIDEPEANAHWIAKWRELDERAGRDGMMAASACLSGREDITDRLGEVSCPAVVIHGTEDTAITMEQAETSDRNN